MSGYTPAPWTTGGVCNPNSDNPTTSIYGPRQSRDHQSGPLIAAKVRLADAPLLCSARDLLEALQRIAELTPGGPHISAKDGMGAALASLDRARDIARHAITKAEDNQ